MKTKIKICGIQDLETLLLCEDLAVDYVGFNLIGSSSRFLQIPKLLNLLDKLNRCSAVVLLLLDELKVYSDILLHPKISTLQIYSNKPLSFNKIKDIRKDSSKKVILPLQINDHFNQDTIAAASQCCDYLMFDSHSNSRLGGTGESFNWDLLKSFSGKEYFLAGGLNIDNIERAIDTLHPFAVDVASGVESAGRKDPEKIKNFVLKIRTHE